jgi:hypothetical protein
VPAPLQLLTALSELSQIDYLGLVGVHEAALFALQAFEPGIQVALRGALSLVAFGGQFGELLELHQ